MEVTQTSLPVPNVASGTIGNQEMALDHTGPIFQTSLHQTSSVLQLVDHNQPSSQILAAAAVTETPLISCHSSVSISGGIFSSFPLQCLGTAMDDPSFSAVGAANDCFLAAPGEVLQCISPCVGVSPLMAEKDQQEEAVEAVTNLLWSQEDHQLERLASLPPEGKLQRSDIVFPIQPSFNVFQRIESLEENNFLSNYQNNLLLKPIQLSNKTTDFCELTQDNLPLEGTQSQKNSGNLTFEVNYSQNFVSSQPVLHQEKSKSAQIQLPAGFTHTDITTIDHDSNKEFEQPFTRGLAQSRDQYMTSDKLNLKPMEVLQKNKGINTGYNPSANNNIQVTTFDIQTGLATNSDRKEKINRQQTTYAAALAAPNALKAPTSGNTKDCAIIVQRLLNSNIDEYISAIWEITGNRTVTYIGQSPDDQNIILAFLKNQEMAIKLVQEGIWLRRRWLKVSLLDEPATKIVVSGVLPFIPDELLTDQLSKYGNLVYPILRRISAATRASAHTGILSFRREAFIVKEKGKILPDHLIIYYDSKTYNLEISTDGPTCYRCGNKGHQAAWCEIDIQKRQDSIQNINSTSSGPVSNKHNIEVKHNTEEEEWHKQTSKKKYFGPLLTSKGSEVDTSKRTENLTVKEGPNPSMRKRSRSSIIIDQVEEALYSNNKLPLVSTPFLDEQHQNSSEQNKKKKIFIKSTGLAGENAMDKTVSSKNGNTLETRQKKQNTVGQEAAPQSQERKNNEITNVHRYVSSDIILAKASTIPSEKEDKHVLRAEGLFSSENKKHNLDNIKQTHNQEDTPDSKFGIDTEFKKKETTIIEKPTLNVSGKENMKSESKPSEQLVCDKIGCGNDDVDRMETETQENEDICTEYIDSLSSDNKKQDGKIITLQTKHVSEDSTLTTIDKPHSLKTIDSKAGTTTTIRTEDKEYMNKVVDRLLMETKGLRASRRQLIVKKFTMKHPNLKQALLQITHGNAPHIESSSAVYKKILLLIEDISNLNMVLNTRSETKQPINRDLSETIQNKNEQMVNDQTKSMYRKEHPPSQLNIHKDDMVIIDKSSNPKQYSLQKTSKKENNRVTGLAEKEEFTYQERLLSSGIIQEEVVSMEEEINYDVED